METAHRIVPPDIMLVEISGRILLGRETQRLEWTLDGLLAEKQRKIVLDMAKVDSIDSAGLGLLINCTGKAKAAGAQLRVAAPAPRVKELFGLTAADKILAVYPTLEEACQGFE